MRLTKNESHQNVLFKDGDDPYIEGYMTADDSTRQQQDDEIASLKDFFKRPIKILDFQWTTLTTTGFFNPWIGYFQNPRVINRLCNYNLLKATLKVKIVVNGNAFMYGRMMVGYSPFLTSDSMTTYSTLNDVVQLSQLPHIFLDPTTSTGGELTCPFFYNRNYVNIRNSNWQEMGLLNWAALNQLRHLNDPLLASVTVSIFAWAEDVQLSVLTSVNPDSMSPQSGEIEEANNRGVVSGPATTVARIANAMAKIPTISPFAKATELAASTVASIAQQFGYCRPSVTKAPDFMKILPTSSFALTNQPDCSLKLSVDHKQEATIDPRISGIMEDDMLSIVNIAKRESYITSFAWVPTDIPGKLLYNQRITPGVWRQGSSNAFHFPATAMACLPFRYWTGTINLRMQVVCSAFHKGRLSVTWDPNWEDKVEPDYNTIYTEIIDISETQDFTVSMSVGQDRTLIPNTMPGVTPLTDIIDFLKFSTPQEFANGVLSISVLNSLTTPSDDKTLSIYVNVYISAGDDFKVFVPFDWFQHFVYNPPFAAALAPDEPELLEEQSGSLIGTNEEQNEPTHNQPEVLYDANSSDMTNLVFTGESIPSFRSMMKRYSLWTSILPTVSATAINCYAMWKFAIYPYQRGPYGNAPDTSTPGNFPYAYCNTLLLHWVTAGFAGWRGNIRYKVVPRIPTGTPVSMFVQRFSNEGVGNEYEPVVRTAAPSYINSGRAARSAIRNSVYNHQTDLSMGGANGMAYTTTTVGGTLEYEVPFYSPFRFAGGRHLGWTAADTWSLGGFYLFLTGFLNYLNVYDVYCAAGEDIQTYFFMGLPRMYYEPTPPTPV